MASPTSADRRRSSSSASMEPTETAPLLQQDSETAVGSGTQSPLRKDSWTGDADFEGMPWWKRPSVFWLIGPYAIFTLAFGGVLVPRLNLIIDLVCRSYFADRHAGDTGPAIVPGSNNPQCRTPDVQRNVATFTLVINVTVGFLSAFTAPRLGALSDRYGRKWVMVVTSCGGIVGEIITILAASFPDVIDYKWLLAASVADGLSGSFTAGSVASHSYTSDCTPPSKRAISFGYMHACLFTGTALGPLLSGYLVEMTGSLLSIFYVTLVCHIIFILFIIFILPESLSQRRQRIAREKHDKEREASLATIREERERDDHDEAFHRRNSSAWISHSTKSIALLRLRAFGRQLRRSNPLAPLRILRPKGHANAAVRRNLTVLAGIDTTLIAAAMSLGGVTLLYSEFAFGWANFETSAFMSLMSTVRVLVLMGVLPVLNYIFRIRPAAHHRRISGEAPAETTSGADMLDVWLIRSAIFSDVIGSVGYIFVRTPALFVLSGVITAFGGLGSATVQSSLTKQVPPDRVGELLGGISLLHAVSRIFAPMIFNGLYAATVASFPQAVFVLVTGVFSCILILSFLVRAHVYLSESSHDDHEPERPASPSQVAQQNEILAENEVVPQM